MIQKSTSLKYEPSSELLHMSVKWLFYPLPQGLAGFERHLITEATVEPVSEGPTPSSSLLLSSLELSDTQVYEA